MNTANKVTAMSLEQAPFTKTSAVHQATNTLRDEVLLLAEVDMFLGSEEDLIKRLNVSRTTFRQAIRILEYEELVVIKRGVGGGFFTRSPTANSVARMAAVYMSFNRTPNTQVLQASTVMRREAVRLITENPNINTRAQLRLFLEANEGFYDWADRRAAIRVVNGFHSLIAKLSGNTAMELFLNVVKMFGNQSDEWIFTVERLKQYSHIINQLALAIEVGDNTLAQHHTEAELTIATEWLNKPRD